MLLPESRDTAPHFGNHIEGSLRSRRVAACPTPVLGIDTRSFGYRTPLREGGAGVARTAARRKEDGRACCRGSR